MKHFTQLAQFLRKNKVWPDVTEKTLSQLIKQELGHSHALKKPFTINKIKLRAHAPESVLLVCAGNLPIAVWQTLTRLSLLEAQTVFLKLPSSAYRKTIQTIAKLFYQKHFIKKLYVVSTITDSLIQKVDAVIVYGHDETIEKFRARVTWKKRFLGYGHKLSCGIIFPQDITSTTAKKVAVDFLTYHQQGCLSPHLFYVLGNVNKFASLLAQEIKIHLTKHPQPVLTPSQKALVYLTRQEALWQKSKVLSPTSDINTTLILDSNPAFNVSCLNSVLYLKHAKNLNHVTKLLQPFHSFLSTVSMSRVKPFTCGATRFCPIGKMQDPSLFWKQDGFGTLHELVRWETIE